MGVWIWWVAAGLALIVVELLSLDLVLVMFAGGALAAGGVAALGGDLWLQILVFALVTVLLLFALRPWLLKHLRARETLVETNVAALPGRPAVTVTAVGPEGGRVKLAGEVWTARSASDAVFPAGADVYVQAIDGATAVVAATAPVPRVGSDQ